MEAQFWIGIHGVIAERGRVVVLKRAARMSYRPGHWDLPGGHLALGETFEQCLAREIAEETGLEVAVERMLGLHKVPSDPYVQGLYACRPVGASHELRLRPDEHAEGRWVTVAELQRMPNLIPYLEGVMRRGLLSYLA
jgi:8-oxo-dGTP pyrophosphatase MutT (NUDIX family)